MSRPATPRSATPAPADTASPPAADEVTKTIFSPAVRKSVLLPTLPPITPMVPARALNDAEKRLEALSVEVQRLKLKEEEREEQLKMARQQALAQRQQEYDLERQMMFEETHQLYLYQREQMYKRLQANFMNHRKQIEIAKREYMQQRGNASDSESDGDGRGRRRSDHKATSLPMQQLKKGEVMVVTTEKVPGFQIVGYCGNIRSSLPRSYERIHLVDDEENNEELQHAGKLAQIIRQEVYEKLLAMARKRGANGIVQFEYGSRIEEGGTNERDAVIVMARGRAVALRPILPEREKRRMRQMAEQDRQERANRTIDHLRELLDEQREVEYDRRKSRRPEDLDEDELRRRLARLAERHKPKRGKGRRSERDRDDPDDKYRDILKNILGSKVRFEGARSKEDEDDRKDDLTQFYGDWGGSDRKEKETRKERQSSYHVGRDSRRRKMDASSVQEALLRALKGQTVFDAADWSGAESASEVDDAPEAGKPADDGVDFQWSSV